MTKKTVAYNIRAFCFRSVARINCDWKYFLTLHRLILQNNKTNKQKTTVFCYNWDFIDLVCSLPTSVQTSQTNKSLQLSMRSCTCTTTLVIVETFMYTMTAYSSACVMTILICTRVHSKCLVTTVAVAIVLVIVVMVSSTLTWIQIKIIIIIIRL